MQTANTLPFALDFSVIDDPEIHALNHDYRGKNKPTDVLSFPLFEGDVSGFDLSFPGESDELALGDLVVSIETAARQAKELGHSLQREMAFLVIHGTLHLLGYDHVKASERRTMWKWQEAIFEAI